MNEFEALFGVKKKAIKKNCILAPLLRREILEELKIKEISKGRLYSAANSKNFTLIHTRVGAGFAGDAVLHLKDTDCRNIVLFGSCGLVGKKDGLDIARLVTPARCYANESFSGLLLKQNINARAFYPHKDFLDDFLKNAPEGNLKKSSCATLASLKLEEGLKSKLSQKGVDIVEMECSAVFSAAGYAGLRAIALFYIADIIGQVPFYAKLKPRHSLALSSAIRRASRLLCDFFKEN